MLGRYGFLKVARAWDNAEMSMPIVRFGIIGMCISGMIYIYPIFIMCGWGRVTCQFSAKYSREQRCHLAASALNMQRVS